MPTGIYTRTEKAKENMRLSHLGKKPTEETRRKMSQAQRGNTRLQDYARENGHPRLGKTHSEETKERIRTNNLGKNVGTRSHLYKHGLSNDKSFRAWQKNLWHKRKRNAKGTHTWEEWCEVKEKSNFSCVFCGKREPEIKLTQDHIIPLSKGGTNSIENIQPLCLTCNLKKGVK